MIEEWPATKLNTDTTLMHKSNMYSKADTPAGTGESQISIIANVSITLSKDSKASLIVLLYEASVLPHITDKNGRITCCGGCPGIQNSRPDEYFMQKINESENPEYPPFNVTKTGTYTLLFLPCEYNASIDNITIGGICSWKNPYGYLPGSIYMLLPIYGGFAIFYLVLLIFYSILTIIYRKVLMKVQYVILFVILMSTFTSASWYFFRHTNNETGEYSVPALSVVVLIAAVRQTALHLLTLLVSMGIGTVKWTLGTTRAKLGLLTLLYLFFTFILYFVTELNLVKKTLVVSPNLFKIVIAVPFALLSVAFYYWIWLSLIRTIQQLTLRRQTLKHHMYKILFAILAITAVFALSGGLYSIIITNHVNNKNQADTEMAWKRAWWGECFIESMFMFVTVSLALLWRPSSNNQLYGYAEYFAPDSAPQDALDKDDTTIQLETLTIVGGGELNQRRKGSSGHEHDKPEIIENVAAGIVLTEFDKDILAFDLSDDSDEASVQTQIKKLD